MLPPKVEREEKFIGRPLDIVENQENGNEMKQKNKQNFDKTYKQHKEKKKKWHIAQHKQENNKYNETYQQWCHH